MRGLFLLLLAATTPALAADIFSPVPGDLSLTMLLQPVFGSLFGGEGDGPLGDALGIFNVCALTIGGLLAAYTMVAGTMQTAHDGEMLGKRWSSMWVPIRLSIGIAALVPVGSSYCAAQIFVAWLGMQGIGLADKVWSAFASSSFTSQSLASATAPTPNASRLAFGMLRSQICMKGFARLAQDGRGVLFTGMPASTGDMNNQRRYGVPGLSATQCGGVLGSEASSGAMANVAGFLGIRTGAAEKAAAIRQAHASAAMALEAELSGIAEGIVNGHASGAEAAYIAAVAHYQQAIGRAALAQMGDKAYFEQVSRGAEQDGWVLAGSWFMRMTALQSTVMQAIEDTPTALPVEDAGAHTTDMNRYYNALHGAVRDASVTGLDNTMLADRAREDSESGIVMAAINSVFNKITDSSRAGFNFLSDADSQRHPLLVASAAGNQMITWAMGLAVASIAVSHLGGFTIALVLGAFVLALLTTGITLSVVLPMLPFIMWMGAVLLWLLLTVESIIGAPLWAVMHLYPRGEEIHGGASAGYRLALDLVLRPTLMVFGFAAAVVLTTPVAQLINMVFFSTFELSQGGYVGFISMLSVVAIWSALLLTLMRTAFGFSHRVPDQVMKWIGGGHGSGLAEAGGTGNAVEHQSSAATSAVTGAVAGAATSKLNTLAHRPKKRVATEIDSDDSSAAQQSAASHAPAGELMGRVEGHDKANEEAVQDAFDQTSRPH